MTNLALQTQLNSDFGTLSEKIIANNILFWNLDSEDLDFILKECSEVTFRKNDALFFEEDLKNRIYFLLSGSVQIQVEDQHSNQEKRSRILKAGHSISNFSIFTKERLQYSCYALEETKALMLSRKKLLQILYSRPKICFEMIKLLAQLNHRLTNSQNYMEYFKEEYFNLDSRIINIFPQSLLIKYGFVPIFFKRDQLWLALKHPFQENFFRILDSMHLGVKIKFFTIDEVDFVRILRVLQDLYDGKREKISLKEKSEETPSLDRLLTHSFLFSKLKDSNLEKMKPYFHWETLSDQEPLFSNSEKSNRFHLIQSGKIVFSKKTPSGTFKEKFILRKNDPFGEFSLMTKSSYSLNAYSKGETRIAYLEKKDFLSLLKDPEYAIAILKNLAFQIQRIQYQFRVQERIQIDSFSKIPRGIIPLSVLKENEILPLSFDGKMIQLGVVCCPDFDFLCSIISQYFLKYRIRIQKISKASFQSGIEFLEKSS